MFGYISPGGLDLSWLRLSHVAVSFLLLFVPLRSQHRRRRSWRRVHLLRAEQDRRAHGDRWPGKLSTSCSVLLSLSYASHTSLCVRPGLTAWNARTAGAPLERAAVEGVAAAQAWEAQATFCVL